jgi:hypothetical protein
MIDYLNYVDLSSFAYDLKRRLFEEKNTKSRAQGNVPKVNVVTDHLFLPSQWQ